MRLPPGDLARRKGGDGSPAGESRATSATEQSRHASGCPRPQKISHRDPRDLDAAVNDPRPPVRYWESPFEFTPASRPDDSWITPLAQRAVDATEAAKDEKNAQDRRPIRTVHPQPVVETAITEPSGVDLLWNAHADLEFDAQGTPVLVPRKRAEDPPLPQRMRMTEAQNRERVLARETRHPGSHSWRRETVPRMPLAQTTSPACAKVSRGNGWGGARPGAGRKKVST